MARHATHRRRVWRALPAVPAPAPQCDHSPDSGRPPAEQTPGGRPDTTTPAVPARPHGLRQVTLSDAGHTRYGQLCGVPHPTGIRVPDPRFRTAKTPAGRRSSRPDPAPGGQPDPPHPTRGSEGLTLTNGSAGALCLTCIAGY